MSSSDAIYEVEKILETRKVKQQRQYLIRWKGYDSSADTWEPAENLSDCIEALTEFHSSRGEDFSRRPKKKTKGYFEYVDPKSLRPKDCFWDDLESGKVDVFATDMYSRAKRANTQQTLRENSSQPQDISTIIQTADRWWTTDASDSEIPDSQQQKELQTKESSTTTAKPFIGICSETMKRASVAMAAATEQEMESGELTDSDDGSTYTPSEGRKRSKKKKHKHERDHISGKKHKKKEKKDKDIRRKERRDRLSEDGVNNGTSNNPSSTKYSLSSEATGAGGEPVKSPYHSTSLAGVFKHLSDADSCSSTESRALSASSLQRFSPSQGHEQQQSERKTQESHTPKDSECGKGFSGSQQTQQQQSVAKHKLHAGRGRPSIANPNRPSSKKFGISDNGDDKHPKSVRQSPAEPSEETVPPSKCPRRSSAETDAVATNPDSQSKKQATSSDELSSSTQVKPTRPKSGTERKTDGPGRPSVPRIPRLPPCVIPGRKSDSNGSKQNKSTAKSATTSKSTVQTSAIADMTTAAAKVVDQGSTYDNEVTEGAVAPSVDQSASTATTKIDKDGVQEPALPSNVIDEPSDDEMSEADLCIVEETGECPGMSQDSFQVVDEVGSDGKPLGENVLINGPHSVNSTCPKPDEKNPRGESSESEVDSGNQRAKSLTESHILRESSGKSNESGVMKQPPLPVRLPAGPLRPRGQQTNEKPPSETLQHPLSKKRRFNDPMWDELDTFPVLHSLEELEKAHSDDIKRLAVKVTLEELAERVKIGDTWRVKYALEHDDCPRLDDSDPPLVLLAAQRGFDDILEMLLSKKADVNKANSNSITPLMLAAEGGFITTTSILLTCGAHMNTVNLKGETAMIRAVKRGHTKTVKKLLEWGANFNAMISDSRHAVYFARQMNHSELDNLITRHERYVESQIEEKAKQSLESIGKIVEQILPVHVLSFWEAEEFHIWFKGRVYPVKQGEGNLLFLANAVFQDGEVRCQLRGECFVEKVVLNDVEQQSVTKAGRFVMSLSPLHDGSNKCTIYTKQVPHPSLRCIVTAYRVRLHAR